MESLESRIQRLGALTDRVRRSLYEHVVAAGRPVTRDEAAEAVGVSRSLAAYHLDRLADEELLEAGFERERPGGPGAGRPAKTYTRSAREVAVSLPRRDDGLAAHLLAEAVERSGASEAAELAAHELGRSLAAEARARTEGRGAAAALSVARRVLAERGYEPFEEGAVEEGAVEEGAVEEGAVEEGTVEEGAGVLALRNCPFDHLTDEHRELVCAMNLALLRGLVDGLGLGEERASLDPRPGRCCVILSAA